MSPEEFSEFRHDAVHALMGLNEACEREFEISSWPFWFYDFDRGTLTFMDKNKAPRVVASIRVVGTTSKAAGTWLWSWANESIPREMSEAMSRVRSFGEREMLAELTTAESTDHEHLGWEMTAI